MSWKYNLYISHLFYKHGALSDLLYTNSVHFHYISIIKANVSYLLKATVNLFFHNYSTAFLHGSVYETDVPQQAGLIQQNMVKYAVVDGLLWQGWKGRQYKCVLSVNGRPNRYKALAS